VRIAHPLVIDPLYYQVFLNGVPVSGCVEADEEAGYVRCYVRNERNQIVRTANRDMVTAHYYGDVVVACDEYLTRCPPLFGQKALVC